MKFLIILTPLALTLVLGSCSKQEVNGSADASTATTTPKPYPLEVCLVSGEELGSMGEPVVIIHEGQEIRFCCDRCQPKFEADPERYLSKLSQAEHP